MATVTPEVSDQGTYLGASGGGGFYTPPTSAPIPGSPTGTFDVPVPFTGKLPVELAPPADSGCGDGCGGGGTTITPQPAPGGGTISPGGTTAIERTLASLTPSEASLFTKADTVNKNWLWLLVAAGVGYVVGKKM